MKLCVLCNGISDSILVGSSKVFKFVSVLVENKSWHSLNSFLACNVACFIYINLKTSFFKANGSGLCAKFYSGLIHRVAYEKNHSTILNKDTNVFLLVEIDRNKSSATLQPCKQIVVKCCIMESTRKYHF